jgi:hypothetical protein
MSITLQRAKRELKLETSKLPEKIGPGTYDPKLDHDLRER